MILFNAFSCLNNAVDFIIKKYVSKTCERFMITLLFDKI